MSYYIFYLRKKIVPKLLFVINGCCFLLLFIKTGISIFLLNYIVRHIKRWGITSGLTKWHKNSERIISIESVCKAVSKMNNSHDNWKTLILIFRILMRNFFSIFKLFKKICLTGSVFFCILTHLEPSVGRRSQAIFGARSSFYFYFRPSIKGSREPGRNLFLRVLPEWSFDPVSLGLGRRELLSEREKKKRGEEKKNEWQRFVAKNTKWRNPAGRKKRERKKMVILFLQPRH